MQICFGTFPIFAKVALRETTPIVITFLRVVAGAVVLTVVSRLLEPESPPFSWPERRTLAGLAALGIVINQLLFIGGLHRTTATNTTVLATTIPVFALLVGRLAGRERLDPRRVLGIAVALLGVLLILDLTRLDWRSTTFLGDLMIVANCLSYATFLVFSRGILRRRSAVSVTAALFRWAVPPVTLVALGDLSRLRPASLSREALLCIGAILVFATIVAYAFNTWALARTDASTTAVFVYLQPVVAGSLAWAWLGERPGPVLFAGAALIFSGVGLTVLRPAGAPAARAAPTGSSSRGAP